MTTVPRTGRYQKAPGGYTAFVPDPLPPELDYGTELIRLLVEAEHSLGELAGIGRLLANPRLLTAQAQYREAVLSSRIEGTRTNVNELLLYEVGQETHDEADLREVHNYVVALEYGIQRLETLPLSLRLVREMHEKLMRGVRGDTATPGEFRASQNWIGPPGSTLSDATFVPPPPPQMMQALDALERYLHAEKDPHPSLVRLALIHSHFEMIHPFLDGNGRVGRLLISLLLHHWQMLPQPMLYLSAFFERYRDDYYRGLQGVQEKGAWEEWVAFFLRAVRTQATEAANTATALLQLQKEFRERLAGKRLSKLALPLVDQLFINPFVTPSQLGKEWQVNYRTATNAIGNLEQAGILVEVTGSSRNRTWVAEAVLELIGGDARAVRTLLGPRH